MSQSKRGRKDLISGGGYEGSGMKAVVLGAGGLGRIVCLNLASDERVSEIVVLDRKRDRSRILQMIHGHARVTAVEGDVKDLKTLKRALSGADVAMNATLPEHNLRIMQACLEAGCGYVDSTAFSPAGPDDREGILDQLDLDAVWRPRGVTALVSMGSDPGLSNVMARIAADPFRTIDSIRIRWAASGSREVDGFPLYSREIFLRDALSPPAIWDGHRLVEQGPAEGEEEFEFPSPIGPRRVHLFRHEEVLTLPARLGKPVGRVDYKHAIRPELIRAIWALNGLGLLSPDKRIRLGGVEVPFRDAFLAALPEPSTMVGLLPGALSIVVEVRGEKTDGSKGTVRAWILMSHAEANRRHGSTAEYFLTAASSVAAMMLIGTKRTPRAGVLVPEELPPEIVLPELEKRGVRFQVADRPDMGAEGGTPSR